MGFAPPPAPGSRIQELGDELIIRFAVKRSLAGAVFPLFVAGLICFGLLTDDTLTTPEQISAAVVLAGCAALLALVVAWTCAGQMTLTVKADAFEIRKSIGRFSRTKTYSGVRGVQAAPVMTGEDGDIRRGDFGLELTLRTKKVMVGEGMGEREAEWVAGAVRERVPPAMVVPPGAQWPTGRRLWPAVIPVVAVLLVIYGAVEVLKPAHGSSRSREAEAREAIARNYAVPISPVECTDVDGPEDWRCVAWVRGTAGDFRGKLVLYECSPARVAHNRAGYVDCLPSLVAG